MKESRCVKKNIYIYDRLKTAIVPTPFPIIPIIVYFKLLIYCIAVMVSRGCLLMK